MKNKKYIWIGSFVLSILLLTYSYKDIKLYYYVKMGNKNYYSKNYEKAIEYYEKALKIKEDYNIRINLIITDYQMKNYKKVLESPVENGFLKGNSLVFMFEKNQNNTEDLKKSLEYYKEEILTNDDINIKKNYEIIENRLKEQQNQDNKNNDNNQQENKDKKQSESSDSKKDKNNNNNQQNNDDNQGQDNKDNQNNKQNQDQNKNNQSNQNSNNNQNDLDKNNNEQNNSQENLDNTDQEKNQNNSFEKERENNKNSSSQNSPMDKPQQTKQQKELQLMLKNLEKNEKQSFKNNERLIGVENESGTKNKW